MSWFSRLKNTVRPRRIDDSLEEEIRDHLERRAAALRDTGLNAHDAEREALRAFGSLRRVREDSREARSSVALETTIQDLRYAWRGFRRNPAFSITAVTSLGMAMGALIAVYRVADAAMFRPLPVHQPDRLFTLSVSPASPQGTLGAADTDTFSYPTYQQVREVTEGAAQVALVGSAEQVEAQSPDSAAPFEKLVQQYLSGNAFDTLGVRPVIGRLFSGTDDNGPGIERVAVLSFDYWRRRFGTDQAAVNRLILVNGTSYRIIGVAAQGFFGAEPGKAVDLWLPVMAFDPGVFTNPAARLFRIIGRLGAGERRDQLQRHLQSIVPEVHLIDGATGFASFRRAFARPLAIMGMVAASILLIAVANVASLLMGRVTARAEEMALRLSLGAGRARLARQWFTESALLSVLAAALGWWLATLAAPWLVRLLSTSGEPLRLVLSIDTKAVWFCVAVSATCALVFGVMSTLAATSMPMRGLRRVAGHVAPLGLSRVFVAVQMAFAFCLVIVASTFVVSVRNLFSVDTGFNADHVTVLTLRSELGLNQDALRATQVLQQQVDRLPDVEGAAVAWRAIFDGSPRRDTVVVPGKPPLGRQEIFYRVSSGYFATLRTPLLEGRDLTPGDTDAKEPVATVVNRAFARAYFGAGPVLGRVFQRADGVRHVVVGLAGDSFYENLRGSAQPIAYFPMKPPRIFSMYVRSSRDAVTVMKLVQREASTVTPGIRIMDVTPLNTLIDGTLVTERLLSSLGSVLAAIGLTLAAIGSFGTVNYTVLQRTTEFGIRAALGASRRALIALVVRDIVRIGAVAIIIGFAAAVGSMTLARSQLFGVHIIEPTVVLTAVGIFLVSTTLAIGAPVLRAVTIDPMIALRAGADQ